MSSNHFKPDVGFTQKHWLNASIEICFRIFGGRLLKITNHSLKSCQNILKWLEFLAISKRLFEIIFLTMAFKKLHEAVLTLANSIKGTAVS